MGRVVYINGGFSEGYYLILRFLIFFDGFFFFRYLRCEEVNIVDLLVIYSYNGLYF